MSQAKSWVAFLHQLTVIGFDAPAEKPLKFFKVIDVL